MNSSNYLKSTLHYLAVICLFLFMSMSYWSKFSTSPNKVLFSVDATTHQLFGEIYAKKIFESPGNLLSNQFENLGYGSSFPDKYPPLHLTVVAVVAKLTTLPWQFVNNVLLFIYLIAFIVLFMRILRQSGAGAWTQFFLGTLLVGVLASDDSLNEKGLSLTAVFLVGLQAQLFFSVLLLALILKTMKMVKGNTFTLKDFFILILLMSACLYTNLLAYPFLIIYSLIVCFLMPKGRRILLCLLVSVGLNSFWLIPFVLRSKYSPTLTTYLPVMGHFPNETWPVWILYLCAFCVTGKKYWRWHLGIFAMLVISLLWAVFYQDLSNFKGTQWLFKMPFQFPRYWAYLYVLMLFLSWPLVEVLRSKLKKLKSLLLTSSVLVAGVLVYFPHEGAEVYLKDEHIAEYEKMSGAIKAHQAKNPTYFRRFPQVMVGIGTSVIKNGEPLPTTQIYTSAMKKVFGSEGLRITQVGYRENNVMQLLSIPIQNQLTGADDIGLIYIPAYYNRLLSKALSSKSYIETLKTFDVGFVVCPRFNETSGFCFEQEFLDLTTSIHSTEHWDVRVFSDEHKTYKLKLGIYTKLNTKHRPSRSSADYVNLFERLTLAALTKDLDIYFLESHSSLEQQECGFKHLMSEMDVIVYPESDQKKVLDLSLGKSNVHEKPIFFPIRDIEDLLIYLKDTVEVLPVRNRVEGAGLVFDGVKAPRGFATLIRGPFYDFRINCQKTN